MKSVIIKFYVYLFSITIIAVIIGVGVYKFNGFKFFPITAITPSPEISIVPVLKEIKKIELLYLMKVHIGFFQEDSFEESSKRITRVRGHALIAVNLKNLKLISCDEKQKMITLELSPPEVTQPTVVHNKEDATVTFQEEIAWRKSNAAQTYFAKHVNTRAQENLKEKVSLPHHMDQAKKLTENIFENIFKSAGWTVKIQWAE